MCSLPYLRCMSQKSPFITLRSLKDYFVQVSLIILSLFIATRAERCNQAHKQASKLQVYLEAIQTDLEGEIEENTRNIFDCEKDVAELQRCIDLANYDAVDSLDLSVINLIRVMGRGVFRSFEPTTFDVMANTGDIILINDLQFRNTLAGTFAFRDNYLRKDLEAYDKETLRTGEKVGDYIDLACFVAIPRNRDKRPSACITDRAAYQQEISNDLQLLLRQAQLRTFHLQTANQYAKYAREKVAAARE